MATQPTRRLKMDKPFPLGWGPTMSMGSSRPTDPRPLNPSFGTVDKHSEKHPNIPARFISTKSQLMARASDPLRPLKNDLTNRN